MLDFRYHTFLALCEIMNYTKTAAHLNITQPAVSQHIHFLENEYGCKLFSMSGKTLSITTDGLTLQKYVKRMQGDSILIKRELSFKKHRKPLVFGTTLTIGEFIMPPIIQNLVNDGYDVKVLVENTENLLHKLETGEISFAFIEGFFDKSNYYYQLYKQEEFVCVAKKQTVNSTTSITQLFNNTIIVREHGSGSRDILQRALSEKSITLDCFNKIIEIGNIGAIKKLVSSGMGISFMYKCAVDDTLDIVNVEDFRIMRELNFVCPKDSVMIEDNKKIFNKIFEFSQIK